MAITCLGESQLHYGLRVEFYHQNNQVMAKAYLKDRFLGECVLDHLQIQHWTYETIPDYARKLVERIFNMWAEHEQLAHQSSSRAQEDALKPDEDSDEEIINLSNDRIFEFSKQTTLSASIMTVPCLDQNIKGSQLVEIAHEVIRDFYGCAVDYACEYEKDIGRAVIDPPKEDNGILSILAPVDWFMSLGGWKGMMPSEEVEGYFFYNFANRNPKQKFSGVKIYENVELFSIQDHRIHMPKGFSIEGFDVTKSWEKQGASYVSTVKTDLSYSQIVRALDHIKKSFKVDDVQIALLQFSALSREIDPPTWFLVLSETNQKSTLQFIDYLNALMFGIEPSGLNAAIATGLMTLDLISSGKLTYKKAFQSNGDGGVYPYACFGNNKGTFQNREKLLIHNKQYRDRYRHAQPINLDPYSMKALRKDSARSPVAIKEAIIIKAWLQHTENIQMVTHRQQIGIIEQAVHKLIKRYFYPWMND